MSKYSEIIERLEKATGPDRKIDYMVFTKTAPVDEFSPWSPLVGNHFTSSIDVALALVQRLLPEWSWLVRDDEIGAFCNISAPELRGNPSGDWVDGKTCFPHRAKTAPLAILHALFNALEARERDG